MLTNQTALNLRFFLEVCKFDFEDGIGGWDKTGTAFNNQPTYGDNPTARGFSSPANQQGDWWIGGYEDRPSKETRPGLSQGDGPQGTLTSPPFTIIGKNISFLIGGACNESFSRAELIVNSLVSGISSLLPLSVLDIESLLPKLQKPLTFIQVNLGDIVEEYVAAMVRSLNSLIPFIREQQKK